MFQKKIPKFSIFLFLFDHCFQSEESESVKNLFEGVKNDSIDQIRAALSDCDVNARRNGRTSLHNAVMRSTPKVISFLIEQGANVNALWNVISLSVDYIILYVWSIPYGRYDMDHIIKVISWKSESDFNETIPHCASTNENPIEIYRLLESKGASFTKAVILIISYGFYKRIIYLNTWS